MANNNASTTPEGVQHERLLWGERYEGTRSALIASGVVKAEWFPSHDMPGKKPGTIKRVFCATTADGLRVKLHHEPPYADRWYVDIRVSKEEETKRREEYFREEKKAQRPDGERNGFAFQVAEKAILYRPGHVGHMEPHIVVKGYALYPVQDQGERWGYVVLNASGKGEGEIQYFVPAWTLRDYAHKQSHIRLAVDNRAAG